MDVVQYCWGDVMKEYNIGKYLRAKRNERELTQADLAKEFGVTYQAVSRWENNDSIPDIETLVMIADFYEVSLDDIIGRSKLVKLEQNSSMSHYGYLFVFIYLLLQLLGSSGFYLIYRSLPIIWDVVGVIIFFIFYAFSVLVYFGYYYIISSKSEESKWFIEVALRGTYLVSILNAIIMFNLLYRPLRMNGFDHSEILFVQLLVLHLIPIMTYITMHYVIYRIKFKRLAISFYRYLFPIKRRVIKWFLIIVLLLILPFDYLGMSAMFSILIFLIFAFV